jgi:RNA polymerase sigma-70 factor (ECF subfamily)
MEVIYGRSDNAYSDEMRRSLVKAIQELKPHYRDVIIAIDFENYSYGELAEETNTPEGTLMSRRHRALSLLHKQLKNKKEAQNDELF